MKQLKKIALLICYYGKFPWYFNYFVYTCRCNPTIDFFIITDQALDFLALPDNIKVIYQKINDINTRIFDRLGLTTTVTQGYKLCDFRPAYGLLFPDLLQNYDFWGHCDIDVIFGNIREFITDDLLADYELISVRPDCIPGCFLIYKNSEKINTLFKKSKDYEKAFLMPEYCNFDETNFAHDKFKSGLPYPEIKTPVESMLHVIKKMEA